MITSIVHCDISRALTSNTDGYGWLCNWTSLSCVKTCTYNINQEHTRWIRLTEVNAT